MYTELLVTHLGEYWTHHMCWEIAKNALVGLITFCLGPSISSTPPPLHILYVWYNDYIPDCHYEKKV